MNAIYNAILSVINGRQYNAETLVTKIEAYYIADKLTEAERAELIDLAYEKARDVDQIDIVARLADLEQRVTALEQKEEPEPAPEYPIYTPGYITKKNEIVQFDYDNDGALDLLQYKGGRAETALSPGKIDGWYVLDRNTLEILGTYYKGEFTPVNPEPEEPEEPVEQGDGE